MKHTSILFATCLFLAAVACREAEPFQSHAVSSVSFSILPLEDGDEELTKTSIGAGNSFLWSATDTVGIYPRRGSQVYFAIPEDVAGGSASFDGGDWEFKLGAVYRSYYPFIGNIYLDAANIPVTYMGQKQTGNKNTAHFSKCDFMYTGPTSANEGSLNFSYHHLDSFLLPTVELPAGKYTRLVFSVDEPLFVEKGHYDLTSDEPAIVGTVFSKSLALDLDISFTETETMEVYCPCAPLNLQGHVLTVTVENQEKETFSYTYSPSRAYVAGKIYRLRSSVSFIAESVLLDVTEASVDVGKTLKIGSTVYPENLADKSLIWTSNNTGIATVDADGTVHGISSGTATITATTVRGDAYASCKITVVSTNIPVESISLNKSSITVKKGESVVLIANVQPNNATDKTVTWRSSDTSKATVGQDGTVTGVGEGNTVIWAHAGGKFTTCSVTVYIAVENISLDKTYLTLLIGESANLIATLEPSNPTYGGIEWTSSDSNVASVSSGRVTAYGAGTAIITAKSGDKSASCTVVVNKPPVTDVSLNMTSLSLLKGESQTLKASITPSNADNSILWSSSNASVASVDQNGCVKAVGGGNATISAKAGDIIATCAVSVRVPATSIAIENGTFTISKGQKYKLKLTLLPEDTTDVPYWESRTPGVISVDQEGLLTAINVGGGSIIAKAGDKTAICTITVTMPGGGNEDMGKEIWK